MYRNYGKTTGLLFVLIALLADQLLNAGSSPAIVKLVPLLIGIWILIIVFQTEHERKAKQHLLDQVEHYFRVLSNKTQISRGRMPGASAREIQDILGVISEELVQNYPRTQKYITEVEDRISELIEADDIVVVIGTLEIVQMLAVLHTQLLGMVLD